MVATLERVQVCLAQKEIDARGASRMEIQYAAQMARCLSKVFSSLKVMSAGISVPYRILLKVHAGNGNRQSAFRVAEKIIRYCVKNKIDIDISSNDI